MSASFQIRKDVFDYLTSQLTNVAEIVPEHPSGNLSNLNLAKCVISYIRDASSGLYISDSIESPEIQITCYHPKELMLTKPETGVFKRIKTVMKNFTSNNFKSFHKVRDMYVGYNHDIFCYSGFVIYRFYTSD